jgi:AraC-like DNA-binding protein/mannose-6-phosphate isomerase-like protein (cupin superfamily)
MPGKCLGMQPVRSTDPSDYQAVPRAIAAMAKSFAPGDTIPPHAHERDQVLYATHGLMRVATAREAWVVPPDRALYMPAGVSHGLAMRGRVEMRTLYIMPGVAPGLPEAPAVLEISELLRSLILALLDEPVLYDQKGRGGLLAGLIMNELARAQHLQLVIPMPNDVRLKRLCKALLDDPSRTETLDEWAVEAGASPRTLSRLFSREVGLSFTAWRQRVRFHNAMEAIVRGEPVGSVARANGYTSASAFTAAFRKAMGVTPGSLR